MSASSRTQRSTAPTALRGELRQLPRPVRDGVAARPRRRRSTAGAVAARRRRARPPTSTCAPATCRSRTRTTSRRAQPRALHRAARSARSSPTSRRSARAGDPDAAPGDAAASRRAAALHRPLRRAATRSRPQGGYVTGARVPPLTQATPIADRRGGAHRAVPDAAVLADGRSRDAQLDSIVALRRLREASRRRGGWAHRPPRARARRAWSPGCIAAAALVAICMLIGRRLRS